MTSAVGVPKSCVKAFFAEGIYLYRFDEIPQAIIEVPVSKKIFSKALSEWPTIRTEFNAARRSFAALLVFARCRLFLSIVGAKFFDIA